MNGSLICPYPRINALILDKGERREEKTQREWEERRIKVTDTDIIEFK